jgi:adenylate cyclase
MPSKSNRPFGLWILGSPEESPRTARRRVQILLTATILSFNLLAVAVVCVLAVFALPGPAPSDWHRVTLYNVILGAIYTAAAIGIGVWWGTRLASSHAAWLLSGRPPTPEEQRVVLQLPIFLAAIQAAVWLPAAAIFAGFNALLGDQLTVEVALTLLIGGLLTCANSYVLGELFARPLAARALATGPPSRLQVPGVRVRSILAWALGSAVPAIGCCLVAVVALTRHHFTAGLAITELVLAAIVLTFGLSFTLVSARATADPIKGLREAVARVEAGDLDVSVPIYDGTEIGLLQAGFNRMTAGLRERERIRDVFSRHVGEDVARSALEQGASMRGSSCEVGVLFVDIISSTALATSLSPSAVVDLLNRFFAVVVDVVLEHGGLVNKFEGDGALAVFGAPASLPDPAGAALAAGRALAGRLAAQTPDFEAGIGIAAGTVVAGNIGAPARYEYTVIGDPVNEAARLTDLAKGLPGRVAASQSAVLAASADEASEWALSEEVRLRGRIAPTRIAVPTGVAIRDRAEPA